MENKPKKVKLKTFYLDKLQKLKPNDILFPSLVTLHPAFPSW